MRNETRLKYDAYTVQIGKLNGVGDPSRSFTVAPAVAQMHDAFEGVDPVNLSQLILHDAVSGELTFIPA